MAKKNIAEIEKGAGFFLGFVSNLMDTVREKGVPFSVIYRLATVGGRTTLVKIVDVAYADWQAEQPAMADKPTTVDPSMSSGNPYRGAPNKLRQPSGFSAHIVYVQPEFEELKRWFPAYVNPDYKGKRFDPIERCKDVSRESREVAFEYVHLNRDASNDEVLAEMDRRGLRPALYEELLGFAEKYPDEQRKYPIVALGSETSVRGYRNVAGLWFGDGGRRLSLGWDDLGWLGNYRFLAVRKSGNLPDK